MQTPLAETLLAGLVLLSVTGGRADTTNTWTDSFNGTAFDARWAEDEPNPAVGTVSLDTNNATALFESFGDINMWADRKNAPILWATSPDGNFAFETHVVVSTSQVGSVAGITVYESDGGNPDFGFGLDNWQAGNRIVKFQGLGDNNPNVSQPATGGEAWLRLNLYRGSGVNGTDRYIAQYKLAVDAPWTVLHVYDAAVPNARVGLFLKASGGGRQAEFSYAAMTELPAVWTDLFDGTEFDGRWSKDEPNPAQGSVSLDRTNDVARFESFGALNMWTARANAPILWTTSPAGDFHLETRVTMSTTQHFAQAGITVYDNNNGLPNFIFCLDHWGAAAHQVRLQGLGDNNPNVTFPATGGEAWLRLVVRRDGGVGGLDRYVCQYRLSVSNAWSTLTAYDIDTPNRRVGLFLKANAGGKSADFSYARMGVPMPFGAGDAIKVDFSMAGDDNGGSLTDWNQVGAVGTAIPVGGVVRHGDEAILDNVAISFTNYVAGRVNNDANAAAWAGTTNDPYYVLAADDIYFHGVADDLGVTFAGLDPSLGYNVRIYALIKSNPGNTERFVVTDRGSTRSVENTRADRWGATTLEAAGTVFTGLTVNAEHEIVVTVEDVSALYYPLNAIVLEGVALPPTPPAVTNLGATNMMAVTGSLRGEVTAGTPVPDVTIHWWVPGNVTNIVDMGEQWFAFATDLGGLSLDTEYRYFCVASNALGVATSLTETFTTAATGIVPVVTAAGSNITTAAATIAGEVAAGDPTPVVTVYWGLPGAITNTIDIGEQAGSFSTAVTGLSENTTYATYSLATNVAGVRSSATNTFTTDVSAIIVYVGSVEGSEASDWRTAATPKTMDIDRDNVYGSTLGAVHWARASAGQTTAGSPTLGWALTAAGAQHNNAGYASIDYLGTPGSNTTAGIVVSSLGVELTGVTADYENKTVRVGVMHDILSASEWANDSFKALQVSQTVGGSGDSGVIPLRAGAGGDGVVGMHFCDITHVKPGDRFAINGLNHVGGTTGSAGYVGPVSWDIIDNAALSRGMVLIVK